jgi:PDZ domain
MLPRPGRVRQVQYPLRNDSVLATAQWQSMRGGNIDSLIRLDMRLSHRSEGGLVVDSEGRLLGMTVFGPRQTTLVIPMPTIERVGAKLLADGLIRRGYLGVGLHGIRLDEALAASLSLPDRRAIMVVSVDPNGPARTAGVLVGDVIVGFDGEAVSGVRSVFARLTPESVGKSAELKIHAIGGVSRSSRRCLRLSQCSGERRGGCAADRAHSARTASAAAAGGRSVQQIHCPAPRHNAAHGQVPRRLHRGKIGRYGADRCGGQSHAFGARHDLKLESSG